MSQIAITFLIVNADANPNRYAITYMAPPRIQNDIVKAITSETNHLMQPNNEFVDLFVPLIIFAYFPELPSMPLPLSLLMPCTSSTVFSLTIIFGTGTTIAWAMAFS